MKSTKLERQYQRELEDADDEHLTIVRAIVAMMDKHGISVKDISEYLNGRGSKPG